MVAARGDIFTISAKPYTANNAVVNKVMNKVDVQNPGNVRVEHGKPISTFLFLVRW